LTVWHIFPPWPANGDTATESTNGVAGMTLDEFAALATDDSMIAEALAALAAEWYGEDAPTVDDLDSLADMIGR